MAPGRGEWGRTGGDAGGVSTCGLGAGRTPSRAGSGALTSLLLCSTLLLSCGRYIVSEPRQVASGQPAETAVATTQRVLGDQRYEVLEDDVANRRFRVVAKVSGRGDDQKSFIVIVLDAQGNAVLTGEGHLVQEGKVHRNLDREIRRLAKLLDRGYHRPPPTEETAVAEETDDAAATETSEPGLPSSWVEVSSAPQQWGTGEFTCLPVDLQEGAASELTLQLSDGQSAAVTITLARGEGLCETHCPIDKGCVALGLGDDAQVDALAKRIAGGSVTSSATVLHSSNPVASVALDQHGSLKEPLARAKAKLTSAE